MRPPIRPDRPAAAVPVVAAAVADLRPVAEAIALAALDDATLATLTELLVEAEAVASRWLTARDPGLAGKDKQRRRPVST